MEKQPNPKQVQSSLYCSSYQVYFFLILCILGNAEKSIHHRFPIPNTTPFLKVFGTVSTRVLPFQPGHQPCCPRTPSCLSCTHMQKYLFILSQQFGLHNPLPYIAHLFSLPTGNHQFVLYICKPAFFVMFTSLLYFLIPHISDACVRACSVVSDSL